jgi:cell division protein FtsA
MYATGIGLLIKGIQKAELVKESTESGSLITELVALTEKPKKGQGLFERILQSGAKFIKDDIKDEDYIR